MAETAERKWGFVLHEPLLCQFEGSSVLSGGSLSIAFGGRLPNCYAMVEGGNSTLSDSSSGLLASSAMASSAIGFPADPRTCFVVICHAVILGLIECIPKKGPELVLELVIKKS